MPSSIFVHRRLRLQLFIRCSLPARFKKTETHLVGFGAFDAILDAKGCKCRALVEPVRKGFAHPAFVPRWVVTVNSFVVDVGAVARIYDFISTVIQLINACRVVGFFSLSPNLLPRPFCHSRTYSVLLWTACDCCPYHWASQLPLRC